MKNVRAAWVVSAVALMACGQSETTAPTTEVSRPRAEPIEYIGMTLSKPLATPDAFVALADPLFGEAARTGRAHAGLELEPGVFLTVESDPRTAEQMIARIELAPSRRPMAPRRVIARVPVSFTYGAVFLDTVRVALARAAELVARSERAEPFHLEYKVTSAHGGDLVLGVDHDGANARLIVGINTMRSSLLPGLVNSPAFSGEPYETLSGTVWFTLSRDEFDFFSTRAYGITSGAAQNFRDFQLLPHDWLRITVTPKLADEVVDVAFEVVTTDGRRIPFARSPASYVAGDQFRQTVFRFVDNMMEAEAREAGSSTPFEVPFHYDDPEGGGVVRVVAQGRGGVFRIAYAVDSPVRYLRDVDALPIQSDLVLPTEIPTPMASRCADHGSRDALRGRFTLRFDASSTVRESPTLTTPLRGRVWGSVYRASDVTIAGPKEGAVALASFDFADVDLSSGPSPMTYVVDTELGVGSYQILGFLDVDGNSPPAGEPDVGDPVTLPIGTYTMECESQPVTVEFALLLPEGR